MRLIIASMSGGLDSATVVAKALSEGNLVIPVNFVYGQKHEVERMCYQLLLDHFYNQYKKYIISHIEIDMRDIMETVLDQYQRMRDAGRFLEEKDQEFYVPSRNLVFTAFSAMIGEIMAMWHYRLKIKRIDIALGIHKHTSKDEGGAYHRDYWDITPEFARRMAAVFALNDNIQTGIYAPYVNSHKVDIVKDAVQLGVPYKKTWTCYNPTMTEFGLYVPCKECEACVERQIAGDQAGVPDINDYEITPFPV